MKTKKDLHKSNVGAYEEGGKAKKLAPEKKQKSQKRALIDEIEDDEDLDEYFDSNERESIEDYFDDDEFDDEYDDDDEYEEEK